MLNLQAEILRKEIEHELKGYPSLDELSKKAEELEQLSKIFQKALPPAAKSHGYIKKAVSETAPSDFEDGAFLPRIQERVANAEVLDQMVQHEIAQNEVNNPHGFIITAGFFTKLWDTINSLSTGAKIAALAGASLLATTIYFRKEISNYIFGKDEVNFDVKITAKFHDEGGSNSTMAFSSIANELNIAKLGNAMVLKEAGKHVQQNHPDDFYQTKSISDHHSPAPNAILAIKQNSYNFQDYDCFSDSALVTPQCEYDYTY